MNQTIAVVKKWLETRTATIMIFVVAIFCINAWQQVLPNFFYDNSFAFAAAKQLYEGHGYSLPLTGIENLSAIHYQPIYQWPPGYSWLLAAVKWMTNTDWITATYLLNGFSVSLFLIVAWILLGLTNIPRWLTNSWLLFAGCFPYPFLGIYFSDILSLTFFLSGVALIIYQVKKNFNIFLSILSGILLAGCYALKFLYLPICLAPAVTIFVYGRRNKQAIFKKISLTSLLCSVAGIVFVFIYLKTQTGNGVYVNPTGKGFFPQNLQHFGPVVPSALVDIKWLSVQFSSLLHTPYESMNTVWKWINWLLLPFLVWLVISLKKKQAGHHTKGLVSFNLLTISSIVTISFIALLSLLLAPFRNQYISFWTYVQELRYYAVPVVFIQICMLLAIMYWRSKLFLSICFVLFFVNVSHGIYYLSKKIFIEKKYGRVRSSEEQQVMAYEYVTAGNKTPTVICTDNEIIGNMASAAGAAILRNYKDINQPIKVSVRTRILVIIYDKLLHEIDPFMQMYQPKLIGHRANCYIYESYIKPAP